VSKAGCPNKTTHVATQPNRDINQSLLVASLEKKCPAHENTIIYLITKPEGSLSCP